MKRFSTLILSFFLFAFTISAADKKPASYPAIEFASKMQTGWNLGNSLDARDNWTKKYPLNQGLSSETCWGEEITTEAIIKTGIQNGYKTIRIPVTWCNHIIDDKYTIDPKWMARVKQIVDWSMAAGYYVILNEHHSVHDDMSSPLKKGEGYNLAANSEAESRAFLSAIWTQITQTFNNDYDEHLIFETMNEPRNTNHEHCWSPLPSSCKECKADVQLLNSYNQLILDIIRKSGGNNANRYVMIPGVGTSIETALADYFVLPKDSASDRLIVTVHMYPLDWGGTGKGSHHFDANTKNEITSKMKALNKKFSSKGIPVVIGEYGSAKKAQTYWEDGIEKKIKDYVTTYEDRLNCFTHFAAQTGKYSMPLINWDCGGVDGMATIDRKNCKLVEPDYVAAINQAWKNANGNPDSTQSNIENTPISISDLKVWDAKSSSFDAATGLLKLGPEWKGADIWFGEKDISDFKGIKITYKKATTNIQCWVSYSDESESGRQILKKSEGENSITIKLNSSKKLRQICIMAEKDKASIIIEEISLYL